MRKLLALGIATFGVLAVPAMAQQQKAGKPAADPEKRLCRSVQNTGSIMPGRKECHTKAEWAQIDGMNQDNAQRAGDRARGGVMPDRQ